MNLADAGAQTNTTRQPPPAGLGGLGLPEFDRMFGSMQDTTSLNQFIQNPGVSQMLQSLLSNPEQMIQVLHATLSGERLMVEREGSCFLISFRC